MKSQVGTLLLKDKTNSREKEKNKGMMAKGIDDLQHENYFRICRIRELGIKIYDRDKSINKQPEKLSKTDGEKAKLCREHDILHMSEQQLTNKINKLKKEFQKSLNCEINITSMKLQNNDSLRIEGHKQIVSESDATLQKLIEAKSLLAEKSGWLSEMIEHNRDVQIVLEEEQRERHILEEKFSRGQADFEEMIKGMRNVQYELRRKESVFESKLRKEIYQREYANEALKPAKSKFKEAAKMKNSVTELEIDNGELKDRIHRQIAYLKRKLKKEKVDRISSKKINNRIQRKTVRTSNGRSRLLPSSSSSFCAFSRSKF